MKPSILITRPVGDGGVANYYDSIRCYLLPSIKYCVIHNPHAITLFQKLCALPLLLWRFVWDLQGVNLVCLNPSLVPKSYYRDMFLLLLAKLFRKKIVVFFRGWDIGFETKLRSSFMNQYVFKYTYGKADACIVLGDIFKQKLISMGVQSPIFKMTTVANGDGCSDEVIKQRSVLLTQTIHCLFMARLVPGKGIDEAIDLYQMLKKKMPNHHVTLTIAGDGPELPRLMRYIKGQKIEGVKCVGYVRGKDKEELLKRMHLLLFPSYTEGLPNTILEAMLNGLIIVSTPVGGIPDIVIDGKNGVLFRLSERAAAAERLVELSGDINKATQIALLNMQIARMTFRPEKVAQRLEEILHSVQVLP